MPETRRTAYPPAIEIVGPLPTELQNPNPFAAAIMAGAGDIEASQAPVNFLHTPKGV